MNYFYIGFRDFFKTAFFTWFLLVVFELLQPGAVQRYLNLEFWFYALILAYLIMLLLQKYR